MSTQLPVMLSLHIRIPFHLLLNTQLARIVRICNFQHWKTTVLWNGTNCIKPRKGGERERERERERVLLCTLRFQHILEMCWITKVKQVTSDKLGAGSEDETFSILEEDNSFTLT
jgi:hypothetical protein